jgi:hypothetical protein
MNLKFIEGRKTCNKVVEFRGMGVSYKEVVYDKGEGGGVGVVSEEHGGGGLREAMWVRRETRRSWDNRPDWGRPGTVLRTSQNRKGLPRE